MEGAVLIGSIALGFVGRSDAIKQAFMQTMVLVVQDFLREITGQEASWGEPEVAAEHERAGRA
jgi:hypothetical protein